MIAQAAFRVALVLAVCLAIPPRLAKASGQEQGMRRPLLGGHTFIWNPATRDPFPRTFIRSTVGVGKTVDRVLIPSFEIEGKVVEEVRGDLLFAELDFAYQHRVQDWLAVWGRFNLGARLGTTTGALLSEGITTLTGMELGWLVRLVQTRSVILSGTANLWSDGLTDVDVLRWARGLGDEDGPGLVESSPAVRGGGGLRFAWGINKGWGVLFMGESGYGESASPNQADGWVWDFAGGVSFDLSAYTDVPIGFVLSGASKGFDRETSNPGIRTDEVGLRLAFTDRDDFLLAVDSKWSLFDTVEGDDVGVIRLGLALQYYF